MNRAIQNYRALFNHDRAGGCLADLAEGGTAPSFSRGILGIFQSKQAVHIHMNAPMIATIPVFPIVQ
jgi:hypothetical protein